MSYILTIFKRENTGDSHVQEVMLEIATIGHTWPVQGQEPMEKIGTEDMHGLVLLSYFLLILGTGKCVLVAISNMTPLNVTIQYKYVCPNVKSEY